MTGNREPFLELIVRDIRKRLKHLYRSGNPDRLEAAANQASRPRGFLKRLEHTARRSGFALITEFKRASPSKGKIANHLHAGRVALAYEMNGAACLSIVTEEDHFAGSAEDLITGASASSLPVLRKDFILDPLQITEARAMGADAVLLIAGLFCASRLKNLLESATTWGMDALVEVHTSSEMDTALKAGARLIGINNRNLQTFATDLKTTSRLAPQAVRSGAFVVGESGVHKRSDLVHFKRAGVRAALVGTTLMQNRQPGTGVAALLAAPGRPGVQAPPRGWIKVCGITTPKAINAARTAGADAVGFVFAPSPRRVSLEDARELARLITPGIARIGVFVNPSEEEIYRANRAVKLDWLQLHGDETPEQCQMLGSQGYLIMKGLQVGGHRHLEKVRKYARVSDAVLLDCQHPELRGGTGETIDWDLAKEASTLSAEAGSRLVLAGGLQPENVHQAIATVQPGGVDASSGLEREPGVKDVQKIVKYVEGARRAFGGESNHD